MNMMAGFRGESVILQKWKDFSHDRATFSEKPTQVWLTPCMITVKRYSQYKTRKTLKKSLADFEYVPSNNITDNIHCLAF